jgi:hypothetical protein
MDDAYDTVRNQRVRAVNASAARFPDRYLCPVCQFEVFYAAGEYQSPHFRHRPGEESDDCERKAKNFHRDVPLSQHEYEHLDAVLVALQTAGPQGNVVTFAARFRPAYKAGFVNFIAGDTSTPYTIHPNLRQQYFRIATPEKNYLIKAQLKGRDHELHIVEGFEDLPVVFRATDREAVRIPRHRVLKPGGYVVVSRKPIHDFPAQVKAQPLKTITGLYAALIEIPEDPDWRVQGNLKSLLGFDIAARVADWGFLSPTSAYEVGPDCWEISKDAEVAIFVRVARHLVPRYTKLLVQERRSGRLASDYLAWREDADEFVIHSKPGPGRPDLIRFGLAHPIQFLFEVRFTKDVVLPQCANIFFKFASSADIRTRLTWTAHELPAALVGVSRGSGSLLSVALPRALEVTLSDHSGQPPVTIPQAAPVEKMLTFLRRARFPCILSATGYPDVLLPGRRPMVRRPVVSVRAARAAVPRSRAQARLLSAFGRRRVSAYTVRSIPL